jgi:molybdenum cofactor guanylyltransferase
MYNIMREKHQKHAKLARPNLGNFARNEWAIIGTPCGNIQNLAKSIAEKWTPQYKVGYVDADHKSGDVGSSLAPFAAEYTDKIGFHRLDFEQKNWTNFQFRPLFNHADIVLVNGNHFTANRQIVVLDPKKMESLSRKIDRLTQIDLFLCLDTEGSSLENFKQIAKIEDQNQWADVPIFSIHDVDKIADCLAAKRTQPVLKSLILAGGKSQRMGSDKAMLTYHGKPQSQFLVDILRACPDFSSGSPNLEPHLSCRKEQMLDFIMDLADENVPIIADTFTDLGPFGAILSAFRHDPNAAWLVIACDLPLLDAETLEFLIKNRNLSAVATAFKSPQSEDSFPEPLITIWEPRAYPILLSFLAQGISCPRKVLINSDSHLLNAPNPESLFNANTPEEKGYIELKIKQLEAII